MTMVARYPSKKVMKEHIGQPLRYIETSMFGNEYKGDGWYTVANRPHITHMGREFFAQVQVVNGVIAKVK